MVTMSSVQPGIWILDNKGKTVFANERMADILQASFSEMMDYDSFIFPEDLEASRLRFECKKVGYSTFYRCRLRRKDGSAIWVEVQGTSMHNAAGAFTGVVGTFSTG